MSIDPIQNSLNAMSTQAKQIEAASENISQANTVYSSPSAVKPPLEVNSQGLIVEQKSGVKKIYLPTHPLADKSGYVYKANINEPQTLVEMKMAQRLYQANSKSFLSSQAINQQALEIGGK